MACAWNSRHAMFASPSLVSHCKYAETTETFFFCGSSDVLTSENVMSFREQMSAVVRTGNINKI